MSLTEKKQVLLHIVEEADEKLTGLLIALANEYNQPDYLFSEEDLAEFNRRREAYFKNPNNVYTMEEALNKIRTHLQK